MALPESVSKATVLAGTGIDFAGNDVNLTVKVTPVLGGNAERIVHAATGTPVYAFTNEYKGVSGPATFVVPHVNQSGFIDGSGNAVTNWAYKVEVTAEKGSSRKTHTKSFQPLVGQANIDFDTIPDGSVSAPVSAPIPAVLSVNGQTGNVTVTVDAGVVASAVANYLTANPPSVSWGSIGSVPSTFPPSSHSHNMSGVSGLTDALEAVNNSIAALDIDDVMEGSGPDVGEAIVWNGTHWVPGPVASSSGGNLTVIKRNGNGTWPGLPTPAPPFVQWWDLTGLAASDPPAFRPGQDLIYYPGTI